MEIDDQLALLEAAVVGTARGVVNRRRELPLAKIWLDEALYEVYEDLTAAVRALEAYEADGEQ